MYQVLYRKYRPRVFADVYGQDHVTSTLKNEIKEGRISHAYLFTGSRGTGKTTCAKILAKAVNCPNAVDGEPCNACEICKGLDSGTIYDVVEIDAASNNGVDNIRDLREEVNYTPTRGKYRVYIIDEVHMLSTGAFNALLKTLEEPPAHVIFILATTEVHKLPATILSRCQRFDFKRIQPETMAVRLQQVAGLEGMELAPDAATLIARIADGALRDGLSILDQCAGRSKQITAQLVSEVAGLAGREALYRLSDAVLARDSSAAVEELAQLHENSYDMERLCVEMINHFRNFMMVKTVKKSRELIICTDDEYKHIEASAGQFTLAQILRGLDLFQSTLVKIKGGATPRIEMEMAFIRLCEPKLETDPDAINQRLSALERTVQNGVPTAPVKTVQSPAPATRPAPAQPTVPPTPQPTPATAAPAPEPEPVAPAEPTPTQTPMAEPAPVQPEPPVPPEPAAAAPSPAPAADSEQKLFMQWADLMEILHRTDIALFGVLSGSQGYTRGEFFLIDSPNPTIKEFIKISTHAKAIRAALHELTGHNYKLGLFKKKSTEQAPRRDPLEDLLSKARENHIQIEEH
ncbi:MAG: DNA polymerase III subunit gamma/tau [Acutalibacteraceae bacterium]